MRRLTALVTLAWCASAHAGGLVVEGASPREIGRAGTGTVGDDGGGALLVNPAAMARRGTWRVQVGSTLADDAIDWRPATGNAPLARDQGGSTLLPIVAVEGAVGDWIIGAGAMTSAASERALRAPGALPPDQYGNLFDYRYGGISSSLRRDTFTLGVARRIGDDVAFGVALGASRVSIHEARRVWVDHRIGLQIDDTDPSHDVDLAFDADDPLSPSIVVGVLVAPPDTRLELGASIGWADAANVSGSVGAIGIAQTQVFADSPRASLAIREPLTARAGVRYDGSRWIGELGGDLWMMPPTDEVWQLHGMRVVDATGTPVDLEAVPSRLAMRTHAAVRGALDVELVAGFLWATAGYAYTSSATPGARLSPTFGELTGHTAALGLEASAGGFTITLGWSRTWSIARTISATDWRHDNPFGTPDSPIVAGHLDGSRDLVGLSIDAELDSAP